jgi:IS5 family transposase
MGPKSKHPESGNLFQQELVDQINMEHPLVKLAELIEWQEFEHAWSGLFPSKRGRPATSTRLIAGLLYLQHAQGCSDEELLWTWVENPYMQYFCGMTHFQHRLPIDPSSMTRWRKRLGESGVEKLLEQTIEAAKKGRVIKERSLERVIVDSTVMEKAVAFPTDSRLLERGRQHLVRLADLLGMKLRQNYNRQAPRMAVQVARYAHAKQFKRMRAELKRLRTVVGRVWRDIEWQMASVSDERLQDRASSILSRVKRLLEQKQGDKNKLYSMHAPEVECIGKGKVRHPYEFGVKVSVTVTHKEGLVVGMKSLPGNPYDGHSLAGALKQVGELTGKLPKAVFVDKGYRGVEIADTQIWRSGQKRGVTASIRKAIHRRSMVEPMIGHMKSEGRLGRNWLQGAEGDAIHAVLCGAGHNLRMILRALRLFWAFIFMVLLECVAITGQAGCTKIAIQPSKCG